jgi:hypothetical protein
MGKLYLILGLVAALQVLLLFEMGSLRITETLMLRGEKITIDALGKVACK